MCLKLKRTAVWVCCLFLAVLLVSCSGNGGLWLDSKPQLSNPDFERKPPPLLLSRYVGKVVEMREDGERLAEIDLSSTEKGYVAVRCTSSAKAKFSVKNNQQEYIYDLYNDGSIEVFPLSMGSGTYEFTVFINLDGESSYEYYLTIEHAVELQSEQAPFKLPNQNVDYKENSPSVELAYEIAKNCQTDTEVVAQVYYWVQQNIKYDKEKADNVETLKRYRPNVDEILKSKIGICYDYAALVAALLRINGVPCQLIKGDVMMQDKTSVYHAWNMIWLQEKGWVAVKMPSRPEEWAPLDLTFAASLGSNTVQEYFKDNHYTQLSVH